MYVSTVCQYAINYFILATTYLYIRHCVFISSRDSGYNNSYMYIIPPCVPVALLCICIYPYGEVTVWGEEYIHAYYMQVFADGSTHFYTYADQMNSLPEHKTNQQYIVLITSCILTIVNTYRHARCIRLYKHSQPSCRVTAKQNEAARKNKRPSGTNSRQNFTELLYSSQWHILHNIAAYLYSA